MSTTVDYGALGLGDIQVTLNDRVAVVTFNRTKQRNSFTKRMSYELIDVFGLFDKDDRVRVVVLTADPTGAAFSAGADVGSGWDNLWDADTEAERDPVRAHRDTGGKVTMAILRCRKLTIVAVNGHAAGIGMTIQLPFDFRFAWEGAKLIFPFVTRGINAEAISSYLLPRLVGYSRASSLFLTGEALSPTSPYMLPLFHKILSSRLDVFPAALSFAHHLAKTTSATSVAMTKALMWRGADTPEEQHLLESRAIRALGQSKDGEEGVRAFLEKRNPTFTATLSEDLPTWVPWWNEVDVTYKKAKL